MPQTVPPRPAPVGPHPVVLRGKLRGPVKSPSRKELVAALQRPPARSWLRRHRSLAALGVLLVIAVAVVAVVTIRQDVTTTPSSKTPLVIFQNGADYTSINTAGFATITLGTSATSATLALSGIPGAAQTSLTNVLKLNNQDATHPEAVTLARSTTLNVAVTSFIVTVKNGATTLLTWDAATTATSSSFTLPVSTVLDISIVVVVTDGTAAGSLGSFGMQFSLAPT